MSAIENKIDDFAETIIEYYDENEQKFEKLEEAINKLHDFYLKPKERGKKIYQYDRNHQKEFQDNVVVISKTFGMMFPIIHDLNEMFKLSQEKIDEKVSQIQTQQQNQQTPVPYIQPSQVFVNTANQGEGVFSKFKNLFGGAKVEELPMELKDSWLISKNLQLEIMNRKQLFKQLIQWHQAGVDMTMRFDDGMEEYLKEEQDFWLETIMPDLMMIAEHGYTLSKKAKVEVIQKMYGVALETHTAEKQMSMFGSTQPTQA